MAKFMARDTYNLIFGVIGSVLLAAFSLAVVVAHTMEYQWACDALGKVMTAIWAFVPPIFFWIDWVSYYPMLSAEQRRDVEHTHDLSRNIWLGLLAILAITFDATPFGGH